MTMDNLTLEKAIKLVNNQFGKNVARSIDEVGDVEWLPTDLFEFNQASNLGGIPLGRIIEMAGMQSSGKTTLAWQIGASLQRQTKKKILFYDYEQTTSKEYLEKLGVNTRDVVFMVFDDNSLEAGFESLHIMLKTGEFCLTIFDSLATMNPVKEIEKIKEEGFSGTQMPMVKAKVMYECLRNSIPLFRQTNVPIIFINHLIAKPSMNGMPQYGDPEDTPGGNALKFYSDLRITLKPRGFVTRQMEKDGKKVMIKLGRDVQITFIKNKVANPYGSETMTLRNGKGFDIVTSAIKRGIKQGIIVAQTTGKHYLKSDESMQGRSYEKFYDLVSQNKPLLTNILDQLNGVKDAKLDAKTIDVTAAEKDSIPEDAEIVDEDKGLIEL